MPQLDSLINFNHAFMSYKDFLFSENNTLLSNTKNIKMLEVLFSCLNIIMNKDRIKTKDEDPSNYIDENILEQIILIIAEKKNNKYYLNNIEFSTKEEIIKIIRNKIAHGEFIIDETSDNIIFKIEDQDIKISSNQLYSLSILLVERLELYTVSKDYSRSQVFASLPNISKIKREKQISQILENIYHIEYNFNGQDSITPEQKALIEEILRNVPSIISRLEEITKKPVTEEMIRTLFAQHNLEVTPKITKLSETSYREKLEYFILKNIKQFKKMDAKHQVVLISNWYQKLLNDNKPLENLTNGVHYNLYTLSNLPNTNYKDIYEAISNLNSNNLFSSIVEMIVTTELLGFYIHFQYPLENICKSKDNTEDGIDYFDYSTLDLSMLTPTIFNLPEGRQSSYSDAINATKRRLGIISTELNTLELQITNLNRLVNTSTTEEEKTRYQTAIYTVSEKLNKALNRQQEEQELLVERQKELDEFNLSDQTNYYHNRYLIEYIRNAISHGNVYFYYNETDGNITECKLRFINTKDSQVTLDLLVSIQDFEKIFNQDNLRLLDEYLTNQKKGRVL